MIQDNILESPRDHGGTLISIARSSPPTGMSGFWRMVNRWVKQIVERTPSGDSPADVLDSATLAIEEANDQLHDWNRANAPSRNEQFASATVQRIVVRDDDRGYDIYVKLSNVAGDTVTILLPSPRPIG